MKSLWSSQNARHKSLLIVGLGNPGLEYEETRHNIGFLVVKAFAREHGMTFRKVSRLKGVLAEKNLKEGKLFLLLPMTYMNCSGVSVRACLDYFKLSFKEMIVVSDDKDLELGSLRLKKKGSSGGHNGLKSVEENLGTAEYARLKVGIGAPKRGEILADYVLSSLTEEERVSLPGILEEATQMLNLWIKEEATRP